MGYNFPLGLPEGSVRAIVALVVIFGAVIGGLIAHFKGLTMIPDRLWELALIVAAFYFGMRSGASGLIEPVTKEEIKEVFEEILRVGSMLIGN